MQKIRMTENSTGAATKQSHINGVSLPFSDQLNGKLAEFAAGSINIVSIVIKDEVFDVHQVKKGNTSDLDTIMPSQTPGFVLCNLGSGQNSMNYLLSASNVASFRLRMSTLSLNQTKDDLFFIENKFYFAYDGKVN